MIIRTIEVDNWRCIDHAKLSNLPDGVIVLHGPNRSGKSSLFKAVRYCLYDYDHDSGHRDIRNAIPRSTKKPPRILVEFETGGVRYRVSKVFSKGKDGMALLERWASGRWVTEIRDPKEASRRVRDILGCYSSEQGLNRLLWLEQGVTTLPEGKELDETLEKRLESILGTLVTSEDIDFKKRLDKSCSRWFTENMGEKGSSPLVALRTAKKEQEEALRQAGQKLRQAEETTLRLEETEIEISLYQKQVTESEQEVIALGAEHKDSQERRRAHEKALGQLKVAQAEFNSHETVYNNFKQVNRDLAKAENRLIEANAAAESAKHGHEQSTGARIKAELGMTEARNREDMHNQQGGELHDRRRLVDTSNRLAGLKKAISEASAIENEIAKLKDELAKTPAPSEKEIHSLREMSLEILKLRTQLKAGGLHVILTSTNDQTVLTSCDSADTKEISLSGGIPEVLPIQQRVVLRIPQFGSVEVGRQEKDFDLEKAARRCSRLETQFRDKAAAWKENPEAEEVLEHLAKRSMARTHLERELQRYSAKLNELVPAGVAVLDSDRQRAEEELHAVLSRRPSLRDWTPDEAELYKLEEEYQRTSKQLASVRKGADELVSNARQAEQTHAKEHMKAHGAAIEAQANVDNLREQLRKMGDSVSLKDALDKAAERKRDAEREVSDTILTETERTIDDRLRTANAALEQRRARLVTAQRTLDGYRGELKATEGLHAEMVEAERAVQEIAFSLEESTLEAEAHKHLRQLFEHARDSQVRSTMDPIRERVLGWIRSLGIDDYRDVAFEQSYFPSGLISFEAGDDQHAIPFSDESFGTEEQLALLVRLALGGILAKDEPEVAILDDPLTHADPVKHRSMLDILRSAAEGKPASQEGQGQFGQLQLFVLTCHPERFDYLAGAKQIDFVHDSCHSVE